MKKYLSIFLPAVVLMVLAVAGSSALAQTGYGQGIIPKNSNEKEIINKVTDLLPKNWEISYIKRNVAPAFWAGGTDAVEIGLGDPTASFYDDQKQFSYNPTLTLWFCPKKWTGTKKKLQLNAEKFLAVYVGENDRHKVYMLNLGKTSWLTYIDDIKKGLNLKQMN